MTFLEQMAHIGSEVIRAIAWKDKNPEFSRRALERALELFGLTIDDKKNRSKGSRLKELTRLREVLLDYFYSENKFGSTEENWKKYFNSFSYAVRRKT